MVRRGVIIFSNSPEETFAWGLKLGRQLFSFEQSKENKSNVICFFGHLAAGKTTFIKGVVSGVTGISSEEVSSPTFVLLNIYEGKLPVYHFDLYRLKGSDEFFSLGFDEYWETPGISCIEWSERIEAHLPKDCIRVSLETLGGDQRSIEIEGMELF